MLPIQFARSGLAALAVVGLSACVVPGPTDAGFVDAGFGAGVDEGVGADAGVFDAGPGRPVFASCEDASVIISETPPECGCESRQVCRGQVCTWDCTPCSVASPCPQNGRCDYVLPPFCEGMCRFEAPPCVAASPTAVELTLVGWGCHPTLGFCLWHHALDAASASVACLVTPPGIVDGGRTFLGWADAGSLSWASFSSVSCLATADLRSASCVTAEAEVHVTIDADAGFAYGTASAKQPPAAFVGAAESVFRACAPFFRDWDGGSYPYMF